MKAMGWAVVALVHVGAALAANGNAEDVPTIGAVGDELYADAKDLQLRLGGNEAVSMAGLMAQIKAMAADMEAMKQRMATLEAKKFDDFATDGEVTDAVDAAAAGLQKEIFADTDAKSSATNARVDQLAGAVAGFAQTKATVAALAKDMKYVLAHAENVSVCAEDGHAHSGDGECVDPIPSCPKPAQLSNSGTMTLSSEFVIPGVTARHACPKDGTFLKGPEVRTCSEKTGAFTGQAPECLDCKVLNCELCVGAQDRCGTCAYGHDLSVGKDSCDERKDKVIILEGLRPSGWHAPRPYYSASMLEPNAGAWSELLPHAGHPYTGSSGTGALIKGTIYLANYDARSKAAHYVKLAPGSRKWATFTSMEAGGKGVTPGSFYATLNGVGEKEDGFYIFSRTASAVYKPGEDTWTHFPMHSDSSARSYGATVAIKNLIYLLGGGVGGTTASAKVDVFDASTGKFTDGVDMPSARKAHAAATYGGKIFVFGGVDAQNGRLLDSVLMFDPAAAAGSQWSTRKEAPMQMSGMTTGQLPVFASGVVLIPYSYRNDRSTENSFKYDVVNDKWDQGPKMIRPCGNYVALMGSRD